MFSHAGKANKYKIRHYVAASFCTANDISYPVYWLYGYI